MFRRVRDVSRSSERNEEEVNVSVNTERPMSIGPGASESLGCATGVNGFQGLSLVLMQMEKMATQRQLESMELMRTMKESDRSCRIADRRELDRKAEVREFRLELLKGLGNFKEGSQLMGYLSKFERVMADCQIGEDSWVERLFAHLPDRLCNRVAGMRDDGRAYKDIKSALLQAVGETPRTYGHLLFEDRSESLKSKSATEIVEFIERMCQGMFANCKTVSDCIAALAAAYTHRVLPMTGRCYFESRDVVTMADLRDAWELWLSGRQKGNFYRPLVSGNGSGSSGSGSNKGGSSNGVFGGYGSGGISCFACGGKGHRSFECPKKSNELGSGGTSGSPSVIGTGIKCFTCGKEGHKSPDCPSKKVGGSVKRNFQLRKVSVVRAGGRSGSIVKGKVNEVVCSILLDTGAEIAMVPRSVVGDDCIDCGDVRVAGAVGEPVVFRSTKVVFEIAGRCVSRLSIVDNNERSDSLCIFPVDLSNAEEVEWVSKAVIESKAKCESSVNGEFTNKVNMLTRAQAAVERELDVCDGDGSAEDLWCVIDDEESAGKDAEVVEEDGSASVVRGEDGSQQVSDRESVEEVDVGDGCEPVEFERLHECESEGDSLLCDLAKEIGPMSVGTDGRDWKEAILKDESVRVWRELADRSERGFKWVNGLLVRGMIVDWEERNDVAVVPREFRKLVLSLGHEKGGHLCADKVLKLIGKRFVWPGMAKDVLGHCRACPTCQVKSKHVPRRAPMVDRPLLSEPFEQVAVDIVGPLPKGKGGCRYLLTYICLATRWPEAVPLRSVTAKAVADGLWEIFSRTSIPEVILTDQGSQFMGRVMKSLCEWLSIERIRTSPYHPQSNGVVERMHGSLKAILGKSVESEKDWVGFVSLALFVLRQMPHADSGHSPFDLVYGFRVRTPLDVLYHCLAEREDGEKLGICDWVGRMAERLDLMRDSAVLNMAVAKVRRKVYLDKGTKLRVFEKDELVLYRVPGRSSKLADSWEGPYVVLERKGEVNYKIGKVGAEKHSRVVHVNSLKKYREEFCINRLDVVVDEQEEKGCVLEGVCEGYDDVCLQGLLVEFGDVFSESPGNTKVVELSIETEGKGPVRQAPYSVPLGIREKVAEELRELEQQGIIERSESHWASPLVPVRKPGGRVRLCVDYRRLNEITVKEPYFIPSLDEMVELVGGGKVLSKIDLSKGFHQVEVKPEDRDKTAFVCPFGKFRYRRMPFGLVNAPSVFQRLMDLVLVDCKDFSRVYIDDILVASSSWGEHMIHLRKLLGVLREAGLTCKRAKCVFGRARLMFLGHCIGDGSVSIPEARVEAIRNHPLPRSRKQLRRFLGMVGYYRRFVEGYHCWSSVLTPHTSKSLVGELTWNEEMLAAFRGLCQSLSCNICLCVPNACDCFVLETDASCTGVGGVLSVEREGERLPVGFFSKQLHGAQRRYSAQELEGLALYESIKHFSYFLYGKGFTVITDHKGLEGLMTKKQMNRRLYGWALKLTEFQFVIIYRKGVENKVADCLSRCYGDEASELAVTESPAQREGGDVGLHPESQTAHKRKEQR